MTNTFPMLIMLSVVTTNWVNFAGDLHREGGTNKVHQYQMVYTNMEAYRVELCTNKLTIMNVGEGTNGVTRWVEASPPLPNHATKE